MAHEKLNTGLPNTLDVNNPDELRRTIERLIELAQTWNGERGDPGNELVTHHELDEHIEAGH